MNDNAPWHAHIYYDASERSAAERLRATFADMMVDDVAPILFIGRMTDGPVGPHPIAPFEIHFSASAGAMASCEETEGQSNAARARVDLGHQDGRRRTQTRTGR